MFFKKIYFGCTENSTVVKHLVVLDISYCLDFSIFIRTKTIFFLYTSRRNSDGENGTIRVDSNNDWYTSKVPNDSVSSSHRSILPDTSSGNGYATTTNFSFFFVDEWNVTKRIYNISRIYGWFPNTWFDLLKPDKDDKSILQTGNIYFGML
ncbi:hypothetical protein K501DRAFT_267812 [Backusella circina FSU 941]|nr:hypothetical protein K501DRAFT_267812 [Backusella circina FSU 941]